MLTSRVAPISTWLFIACLTGCSSSTSGPATSASAGAAAGSSDQSGGAGSSGAAVGGSSPEAGSGNSSAAGSPSAGSVGDPSAGGAGASAGSAGSLDGGGSTNAAGDSAGGQGGLAGGGGVPPANCPAGTLFCEDFESYAAMAPPNGKWSSRTNGTATVVVDTVHAHSGTKAVHFHATTVNNNQRAYILTQGAPAFPVTGDTVYVRFMMYIGRYMSVAGTSIHNRIAWIGAASTLSSGGNGPGYAFVTYNGIAVERLTNPSQGFQRNTGQHLDDAARQNKWQCFEFEIDNKGGVPAGEQPSSTTKPHIWQEGQELTLSAGGSSEPWLPAPWEALQFSLWCPQTDPMPTDYWIDDVVMSTTRNNCPAAQ